ncbi:MAG: hypothetical protein GX137_00270 [Thermoplasmatales archaeon]|nr:hypothetical protein [Thermoplasmatales archaeon]
MKLYGWIPHTYPTLEMKFPKEDFLSRLSKLPQEVYCDDADPQSAMSVKFNVPKEFDYGITKIKTEIKYGEYNPSIEITVYSSGLVLLELDDEYVRSLEIASSETDGGDGDLLDGLRYLIREPYFLLNASSV